MIQPERSRPLWKWDIICALLLILVAVLTPFEAGFLEGEVNSFVGIFNIVTNIFFAADMCMQFFIAYPIETSALGCLASLCDVHEDMARDGSTGRGLLPSATFGVGS